MTEHTTPFVAVRLRASDCVGLALLLLLTLVFFLPVVMNPNAVMYPVYSPFSDLTVIHWPNAELLRETYSQYGQLPLWKGLSLSGMPAIANPLAMLYYPLDFLFLRIPTIPGFNLLNGLHVFLAGLGAWLYARLALERSQPAALLAGIVYMFSGKLLVHIAGGHLSLVAAAAWIPWAFLGVHLALTRRSLLASVLSGIVLALQAVTHSQILIYTAYALLLYAVWELVSWARREGSSDALAVLRHGLILVPAGVVALTLSAIQLLPIVELAGQSNRALSLAEASEYSLSLPQALVGVLLPNPLAGHELTIYPGLIAFVLTLASLPIAVRSRKGAFLVVLAVLGVWISFGQFGLLPALYRVAPGWSWMRAAARAWLFVSFALSGLAAFGLDRLLTVRLTRWERVAAGGFGFACLLLGGGLAVFYGQTNRSSVALALLPIALLIVVALRWAGTLRPGVASALIVILAVVDLWSFGQSVFVFKPAEQVFAERRDLADYVGSKVDRRDLFRTYSPSYSLPQHIAAAHHLQTTDGVEPVHLARYDRFMARAGGYGTAVFSVTIPPFVGNQPIKEMFRDARPDARLMGLLNVRVLVADYPLNVEGLGEDRRIESAWVYRNHLEMPRSFAVFSIRPASGEDEAFRLLDEVDFTREAIVEGMNEPVIGTLGQPVPASVVLHSPNKIVTEVEMPEAGLLVLSEMWYPGWTAYDNGFPVPIVRADYLLRGVWLNAGQHTVSWVYQPQSYRWGTRIAGMGAFLAGLILAFAAWRRSLRRLQTAAAGR